MMKGESYYRGVLPKLEQLARDRNLVFGTLLEGAALPLDVLFTRNANPGQRFPYYINSIDSVIVGFVLVPKPNRNIRNKAWNRIPRSQARSMSKLDQNGINGKKCRVIFLQIWEAEKDVVVMPIRMLEQLPAFREKGDFTVKRECREYSLVAPKWEITGKFKLKIGLEEVFKYI